MNIKIGVDEAGRGPWAGPVFAGLVILNEEQEYFLKQNGINDSKKLSKKKREELFPLILANCIYSKVKYLKVEDIDKIGIYKSTIELIKQLVEGLDIDIPKTKILIDGVFPNLVLMNKGSLMDHECIIKGDEKEPSISAASILAKVRRDKYMEELSKVYPLYSFDKHKGYGTKLHMELLKKYGICEEHRQSFKPIKSYM